MTLREAYQESRKHLEGTGLLTMTERRAIKVCGRYTDAIEEELKNLKAQHLLHIRVMAAIALQNPGKAINIPEGSLDGLPDNMTVELLQIEGGYQLRVTNEDPPPS